MPYVKDLQNGIFELDYRDEPLIHIKHVHQTRLMLDRISVPGDPVFLLVNCGQSMYDLTQENTRLQNSIYQVVCSAYILDKDRLPFVHEFRKKYELTWPAGFFEGREEALSWLTEQKKQYDSKTGSNSG